MAHTPMTADSFRVRCDEHDVHTVELAAPDTQGHLRGKRIPVERFFETTLEAGANLADAIFVFDMANDLPDNEFINMETGFLDCHLVPDISTARILTHRPGYGLVFANALDQFDEPHPLAPRGILAQQIEQCVALGLEPVVATEMEFYLCRDDWQPVQSHIQYSSLTDAPHLEDVLRDMRDGLAGGGIEVESSNAEYGPGQIEINAGHADAMTTADNTALFKSIVKQVAVQHGLRATFMPKPFMDQSGSGMHVHTSLNKDGSNVFRDCETLPSPLMASWVAGMLDHALSATLLATPTSNGPKRVRPYTFAPTHACWGLDNRTVLARCVIAPDSPANRAEFRLAGADANPYLVIAAQLAAGRDGVERGLELPPMGHGDMYGHPGDNPTLPTDLEGAITAYRGSRLAGLLGEKFSRSFVSIAEAEVALAAEHSPDPDDVNDWERARFIEHS
ncbi:MAG: glutamine synthetase family protein [Acidimicrobiales bacterium]